MAGKSSDNPRQGFSLPTEPPATQGIVRHGPYPELTWPAVLVGWLLGSLIALSMSYASLVLGFSIEGSELAAILGWGILRGLMRRTSILENNINQTIASAVNGASAGMMFSIPALFILSTGANGEAPHYAGLTDFSKPLMVLSCIAGAYLGLAFVIPLRRQMIDFDRLAYPGGIAVAAILKSPGAGIRKAGLLISAGLLAAAAHVPVLVHMELGGEPDWHLGQALGWPEFLNVSFYMSLMTVGVGFLSGRGGFWFGAGGFLCYWLLAPLLAATGSPAVRVLSENPDSLQRVLFRPTGIGMLIGAALGGILAALPLIVGAVRSLHDTKPRAGSKGRSAQDDEFPARWLYMGVIAGALTLTVVAYYSVEGMTWPRALVMALLGTAWVWVAGVIVSECVGRTNWSPLSGMTLIGVTMLIFVARGGLGPSSTILSCVILGAAICVAIAQAGDMMLDLKSGFLIGAVPRRQQVAQFIGAWLGPVVVILLIFALHEQYGLGSNRLPAPQGRALASTIEGIVGQDVPTYRYVAGAGLGAMLAGSGLGGIGVMIGLGFYMPFNIVLTYTLGCVSRLVVDRFAGHKFSHDVGVPLAAGLIVGEALVGVGHALIKIFWMG
ncbi:MAG: OPT family oligopeptide transporter [Pirellulaceae bacterium]